MINAGVPAPLLYLGAALRPASVASYPPLRMRVPAAGCRLIKRPLWDNLGSEERLPCVSLLWLRLNPDRLSCATCSRTESRSVALTRQKGLVLASDLPRLLIAIVCMKLLELVVDSRAKANDRSPHSCICPKAALGSPSARVSNADQDGACPAPAVPTCLYLSRFLAGL